MHLKEIDETSSLKVILLVSILELLLTNNYNGSASITKQLSSKMNLVNGLFNEPLIINDYFPKSDNEVKFTQIIGKIYSHRSNIAHGSESDFKNSLQILTSKDNVVKFLSDYVSRLIVFSLKNRKIIEDLKLC